MKYDDDMLLEIMDTLLKEAREFIHNPDDGIPHTGRMTKNQILMFRIGDMQRNFKCRLKGHTHELFCRNCGWQDKEAQKEDRKAAMYEANGGPAFCDKCGGNYGQCSCD